MYFSSDLNNLFFYLTGLPLTRAELGFIAFGGMLFLVLMGMPIGIALMFSSFAGIWLIINKFPDNTCSHK